MLHRYLVPHLLAPMLLCVPVFPLQEKPAQEKPQEEKAGQKTPAPKRIQRRGDKKAIEAADRTSDAYGGIVALALFRQRGQLRGLIKLFNDDGSFREGNITIRFLRRLSKTEDLKRVDLEIPGSPILSIGFDGEKIWGAENGQSIVLRLRAEKIFQAELSKNYETLVRNRELVHELKYVGREKKSGIEFDLIDLLPPDGDPVHYSVSTKSLRILHLEFEVAMPRVDKPIQVRDSFFDFREVQNTLVPFRLERYENDRRVHEIQFTEIAYGITLEESIFKSADDLRPK